MAGARDDGTGTRSRFCERVPCVLGCTLRVHPNDHVDHVDHDHVNIDHVDNDDDAVNIDDVDNLDDVDVDNDDNAVNIDDVDNDDDAADDDTADDDHDVNHDDDAADDVDDTADDHGGPRRGPSLHWGRHGDPGSSRACPATGGRLRPPTEDEPVIRAWARVLGGAARCFSKTRALLGIPSLSELSTLLIQLA